MISSLLLQIVTMICGFIIPHVTLRCFGSAVNGLCNSISQFLNVITLLEGGVTSVILANLYKPLRNNESEKVSSVVAASNKFFKQLALIFAVYAVGLGLVYPLVKKTPFDFEYVVALIWSIGLSSFFQYAYAFSFRILLRAGQRVYIVSYIQIIFNFLNTAAIVAISYLTKNVLLARLGSSIVFLVQPALLSFFANKFFPIRKDIKPDETTLSQRWDSFGQNVAYYIHTNTDIVLLTIFSTFLEISVYTVHSGVISAIRGVAMSISTAIAPSMGNVLAGEHKEETITAFSEYSFVVWYVATILFTTTAEMIEPFVLIYTRSITDVSYNRFLFAVVLIFAESIYCLRDPYISVIYSSGHFKQTKWSAFLEATINILVSVALIKRFGLVGIALGTAIAMLFRAMYSAWYINKVLVAQTLNAFFSRFLAFLFCFGLSVLAGCYIQSFRISNYGQWILFSGVVFILNLLITTAVSFFLFRKTATASFALIIKRKN